MAVTGLPYIFKNGVWTPMSTDARVGKDRALDGAVGAWLNDVEYNAATQEISKWVDESRYGNHFVTNPSAPMPLYGGANIYGNERLTFNGNQGLWVPSFHFPPCKDITIFCSLNRTASIYGNFLRADGNFLVRHRNQHVYLTVYGNNGASACNGGGIASGTNTWTAVRLEAYKSLASEEAKVFYNGINTSNGYTANADNTDDFSSNPPLYLGYDGVTDGHRWNTAKLIIFPYKVTGDHAAYIESKYILNSF